MGFRAMGYNARNDEIRDNVTRIRREWDAQRGAMATVLRTAVERGGGTESLGPAAVALGEPSNSPRRLVRSHLANFLRQGPCDLRTGWRVITKRH
jgi:hypothetical protein